jgi:hypothetical protein
VARRHDALAWRREATEEVGDRVPEERLRDLLADLDELVGNSRQLLRNWS